MPAPTSRRVAAVLALLVTILVTILVARGPVISSAQGPSAPSSPGVRRELRIGAPGVPVILDPGAALEGTTPLIARQVFDTLVAWREGSTEIEPALATRWNASRDGLVRSNDQTSPSREAFQRVASAGSISVLPSRQATSVSKTWRAMRGVVPSRAAPGSRMAGTPGAPMRSSRRTPGLDGALGPCADEITGARAAKIVVRIVTTRARTAAPQR